VSADQQDAALERVTLHLINMVAYGSSSRVQARRLRDVTGIDLPPSDIRVLEFLAGRDPIPLSALAMELGIDLAQASRQASALEASDHVVRATDPSDRRRTLVSLSGTTAGLMDRWLLDWTSGYLVGLEGWSDDEIVQLTRWFDLVRERLEEALPGRSSSKLPQRWEQLVPREDHPALVRQLLSTLIGLIAWAGQSGGFNDLLESLRAPIRQHGYFTLRVVSRHGPMSVAEVAERMAIDPSQASKRLRQLDELGLVDRAVDAFDRRSNRVRVSRKGAALERKVHERQRETFIEVLGELSDADRRRWSALMTRFLARLFEAAVESDRWAGLAAAGGAFSG
jgi:DNA-binding MarR family transcriptional regulator